MARPVRLRGNYHTCGVRTDGTVTCWGDDDYGQASPYTYVQVSVGDNFTCGLKASGTVVCWGDNSYVSAPAGTFTLIESGSEDAVRLARAHFDRNAGDILKCFHPSQKFYNSAIFSAEALGDDQARISGRLDMKGFLGNYYMNVTLDYDARRSRVRVQPGASNTLAGASTACSLRDWTPTGSVSEARRQSQQQFRTDVVTVAAVATVGVVLLSDADARRRVKECTKKAIADGAIDSLAENAINDPAAQALLSGALKEVYADKGSVGGATLNATVHALKQAVAKKDAALGRAIDAAEYLHCMVK